MGVQVQFKGRVETSKYIFELYKEGHIWFANAHTKGAPRGVIHKWTVGPTKKSVLQTIKGFIE